MRDCSNITSFDKGIFSERLKEAMKKANISRKELAKKMHISIDSINHWCIAKSEQYPTTDNLFELCAILDIDLDYLTGRIDAYNHTVEDVSNITGLHPDAVECLIEHHSAYRNFHDLSKDFFSFLIEDTDLFWAIRDYCNIDIYESFSCVVGNPNHIYDSDLDPDAFRELQPDDEGYVSNWGFKVFKEGGASDENGNVNFNYFKNGELPNIDNIFMVETDSKSEIYINGYPFNKSVNKEAALRDIQKHIDALSEKLKSEYFLINKDVKANNYF